MDLDEQTEMREEVIDHLWRQLLEIASNPKTLLTDQELAQLREKLVARSR